MPELTESTAKGEQQVDQPATSPPTLEETRRLFVEAADWARFPLLSTDGTGKANSQIQDIAAAVEEGKTLTPIQVQQTRDAIKLLDSNEIVNQKPILQQLKDTFEVLARSEEKQQQAQRPAAPAQVAAPDRESGPEILRATPAQLKPTTRPAAKVKTPNDDRDDFIRNALPVAAALRRNGKPEEAKQLELVANALLQTKSLERTPAPEQAPAPGKEESIKDLLANVYKAIDQDPALKNMPEVKDMRRASNKLDKDGMLNITVRNGVVTSFVSNFTDNFSRTQKVASAPEAKLAITQGAPAPDLAATLAQAATQAGPTVEAPAPRVVPQSTPASPTAEVPAPRVTAQPAIADSNLKVATLLVTSTADAEPGKGMSDVLTKRLRDAGATVELISTKPTHSTEKSLSELKVSYRLDEPSIAKVSALLDAVKVMPSGKVQETPADQTARQLAATQEYERQAQQAREQQQAQAREQQQAQAREKVQQLVEQPAPLFQAYPAYTSFGPSTENGIIDSRKAISHDSPQLNVAISEKGEFGINPKVDQKRLIGDGIASLGQFFDYALPTSGHHIAHVGLAEPGQMRQTERGWEVVTKGKLAIIDTEGNVFKPQMSEAQAIAPTPAAMVASQAPNSVVAPAPVETLANSQRFALSDVPSELLAKMGVPVADLERTGQLQKLLEGKKTDLIQGFTVPGEPGEPTKFAAKLILDRDAQGVATLRVDLPKHELEIPKQVMGKEITPAMQMQLQTNGVVPLLDGFSDGKGQQFAAYLAIDREMKRVVAVRPEGINVPKEVYGVKLSPDQNKLLLEGRPARIEGMTHPGAKQLVDAVVQLDPLARKLVFRDTWPRPAQEQTITPVQEPPIRRQGVRR